MSIRSYSLSAFYFNDNLVDVYQMRYDARNCGGAKVHAMMGVLTKLHIIAQELMVHFPVEEEEVVALIQRWEELMYGKTVCTKS